MGCAAPRQERGAKASEARYRDVVMRVAGNRWSFARALRRKGSRFERACRGVALILVAMSLQADRCAWAADEPSGEIRVVQSTAKAPDPEELIQLPERSVRDVSIDIQTPGEALPADAAALRFGQKPQPWQPHDWPVREFDWTAPAVGYQPLYFEDANLERYGLSYGIFQPAVSVGRGFGQFMALPYQMTLQPPREIVYPLGYYRPGDRVIYQFERPELDARAAAVEAGVLTGFIFLIP